MSLQRCITLPRALYMPKIACSERDALAAMTHQGVSHGCRELGGMTRSSEVVMRLNGCDATDGMFDLVFSRPQGQPPKLIRWSPSVESNTLSERACENVCASI